MTWFVVVFLISGGIGSGRDARNNRPLVFHSQAKCEAALLRAIQPAGVRFATCVRGGRI